VKINVESAIDGYKFGHRSQYPEETEFVMSNLTPRSTRVDGVNEVVFFGLQYFLQEFLGNEFDRFFESDVDKVADRYARRVNGYLGPDNGVGVDHIRDLHDLGFLPLVFKAWPEGSRVPIGMPMVTVENTLPSYFWLVNYLETLLSCELWLPITSATTALHFRERMNKWAELTGGDLEFVNWQGHDFSMRGMGSVVDASKSGAAHLLSFWGTDTVPALDFIDEYYPGTPEDAIIGGSVAATEHSVMCAGGKDDELETYSRLMDIYPGSNPEGFQILSVVSDTWDLWNVLTNILPQLREKILARNGKLVIRPDSGDPVKIICGDYDADPASPAFKGVVQLLWDEFGGTVNDAGFKVLDPHIGVIYGDGISPDRCERICAGLHDAGFASTNVVFGLGSYTYQYVTRDTYGMAMKATWVQIDGVGSSIFKKPVTDDGGKFSATGRLSVVANPDYWNSVGQPKYHLIQNASKADEDRSLLTEVWRDGEFVRYDSFQTIRNRVGVVS
jgi:nicotinamide phosphoribosyltransferase